MEWLKENATLIGIFMMPLTYGFVGWMTNVVALKMTFYPLKFWGIPPFLGWQGIVPRKAKHLALKSVNMITERLIKLDEFFSKVDPEALEKEFQPTLDEHVPAMVDEIAAGVGIGKDKLTAEARAHIIEHAHKESGHAVKTIAQQMRDNISKIFNFKNFVLKGLTGKNVKRLVDIFQEVGSTEFKFIEKSGLYFGFLLGLVQMGLWHLFPIWWTLPIQGVIVGYVTNWLALTMIFRPLYPKKIMFVTYHGLFLKRQDEVAKKYCGMFANDILTPRNLMEEILYRRAARRVFEAVQHGLENEFKGDGNIDASLHNDRFEEIKKQVLEETINAMAGASSKLEKYMGRALNVERMMYDRMSKLPPEEFEPILRSAFQEDEYILILIGAVLGSLVGLGQALYMLATGQG